jgi:hypothetical protein
MRIKKQEERDPVKKGKILGAFSKCGLALGVLGLFSEAEAML